MDENPNLAEEILSCGISVGYNVEIAKKFGINEAIVLNRLVFLHKNTPRKDKFTWQTANDWYEHTGLSEYQVRNALRNLESKGIVEIKNTWIVGTQIKCKHQRFVLKNNIFSECDSKETAESGTEETKESDSKETAESVNSIEHSIEHSSNKDKSLLVATPQYGNPEINEMFNEWEKMFGFKQKNCASNRNACYNMLRSKDKGKDWLLNTMKIAFEATKDRFAGKAVNGNANFADIQRNWEAVWLWGRKKWEDKQKKGVIEI